MKKTVRQHDITDCASACIASITRHFGKYIPLTLIREASGTSSAGTSIKGIIDACTALGLVAKAYKSDTGDIAVLRSTPLPVILHVLTKEGDLHFVVLYGIGRRRVRVMDPASGTMKRMSFKELKDIWSGFVVTVHPSDKFKELSAGRKGGSVLRYAGLLSRREYAAMVSGTLAYTMAGICISLFLQHIIDNVIPAHDPHELVRACTLMAALMVSAILMGYERIRYSLKVNIKMDCRLMLGYLDHLFHLPVGFFSHRGAGELHSRLDDASKIRAFLADGIITAVTGITMICLSFVLMFVFHRKLALLILLFIPVYLFLYSIADRVNRKVNREVIESSSAFEEKVVEGISAARLIRHFGSEGTIFSGIEKKYVALSDKLFKGGRCVGIFASAADALSKLMTVALLTAGSIFIFEGSLSIGELVSFYALTALFASPISQIIDLNGRYTEAKISAERLEDITLLSREDATACATLPFREGEDIIFENVSFSYPGCPALLERFNAVIPHGKITAIQGESGCGKSTLASLLMRDYTLHEGKIFLGGTDISLIALDEWRRAASIIHQEPEMLNRSILDNICCLEKSPDIKRVASILEDLGLHDFITALPMGLLTPIGERGCTLSGGQKQRIALARALYRDPEILILDEATSSLDNVSQKYVLDKIVRLRDAGKTIVMITHKTDNIAIADNIIRL
ncbi:MAG: peptidase domain-containing ABC transporter [Bacteroidales bacterium]|nr:peptidase domain-containing ABC transporter [Candidatus Cacconaster merdequi]